MKRQVTDGQQSITAEALKNNNWQAEEQTNECNSTGSH
jgi:hypothetical protein